MLLHYHHNSAITIASPTTPNYLHHDCRHYPPHYCFSPPRPQPPPDMSPRNCTIPKVIIDRMHVTAVPVPRLPPCPSPDWLSSSHFEPSTRTAFPSTTVFSAHPAGPSTGSLRPPRTTTFLVGLVFTPRKPSVPASIPPAALQVSGLICSRSLLTASP